MKQWDTNQQYYHLYGKAGVRSLKALNFLRQHQVVDVGEPNEHEIAKVGGVPLLPLSPLEQRFTELDLNQ